MNQSTNYIEDVKYTVTAKMLYDKYNCKSVTDLHDAFLIYIESLRKTKSDWTILQHFAISRSVIKSRLSIFNNDQMFYPLFNGEFISVDNYKGQRLNTMQLLNYLGISKQLLQTQQDKQYTGYVSYSLELCLKQFNVDRFTNSLIMQVCKPFSNGKGIDREIKLMSLDDIQILLRQDVQLDQVIHKQISDNLLFFVDIDLKSNYGILNNKQRELMMSDIHNTLIEVLQLYGCKNIETIIVGVDILQSCHIYTNAVIRIDDCNLIIDMIRTKLIAIGYDRTEQSGNGKSQYLITRVLDSCVYPRNGKSQIRFPSSLKLTMNEIDNSDSESEGSSNQFITRGKRSIIPDNHSLSKFILQPVHIRNLYVVPSYMFSRNTVWELQLEAIENETIETQEQVLAREQWFKNEERIKQMRQNLINKYKGNDGYCSVCQNALQHEVNIQRGTTHFKIQCSSNVIHIEHSKLNNQEETKIQTVVQCQSIVDQFSLEHISTNKYTYNDQCPVCNRNHNSDGNRIVFVNENEKNFILVCVRSKQKIIVPKTLDNTNQQQIVSCSIKQTQATQNNQYLKCDILNSHITFITSAVGTGKTKQISDAINQFQIEQHRDAYVLFLSTRVSFSHTISEQMNTKYGIKFDLYDDISVDLKTCQRLMIQVESLPRLSSRQQSFDFIIIDEAVSVIMQMTNPIGKQAQIITTLQQFVDTSSHIVVCDALLNETVIGLYRKLVNNSSEQVVVNSFQPYLNRVCNIVKCETTQQMKQQYLDQLLIRKNEGQRIYSYFDQRQNGLEVYYNAVLKSGIFKQDEILLLHGDNAKDELDDYDQNVKHHIQKKKTVYKQGDERISKYKLIMTTSTITVGWDSQIDNNFHGLHVLFKMENSNAVHIYQNVHRLRNIQSQTFLHTIEQVKITNQPITIQQYFIRKFGNRYITNSRIMNRAEDFLSHMLAVNDIMINLLNRHKINILQAFMRQLGYQIQFENCCDMKFVDVDGQLQKVKEQFVSFECDQLSLELFASIHRNGINTIQEGDNCITENLKEKMITYNAVMKQVYIGKIKWNQQTPIDEFEQKRCYDIRLNRTIEEIRNKLHSLYPLLSINEPITQCQDVIMNNTGLQKYANRILRLERQEIDIENNAQVLQLYARVLYLCFVTDEKHKNRYAQYVEVNERHNHLFNIACPQKLAVECLKLFNIQYNAKSISEMIKDCQLKLSSKQVRSKNEYNRVYTVELIEV